MKWVYAALHIAGRIIAAIDLIDIAAVAGFGLLVYGVYQLMPEAGFIVAGIVLLGFAVVAARK
jgi:hypothetical protein